MWFKNLYLYRLNKQFALSAEQLEEKLTQRAFHPCQGEQRESMGWVPPLGRDTEALVHSVSGQFLVSMAIQERMLPASVVREELDERISELELRDNRKVSGREKKELREQIEFELLPRAFTRTRRIDAWIDTQDAWFIVDTSSATQAEKLTTLLRKTLDTLPLGSPEPSIAPATLMTHWLREEASLPKPFELGGECELRSPQDEKQVANFKNHELTGEEVQSNLETGKYVSKLALSWDEKVSFLLTDDLQIRRLKFLDVLAERLDENDPQSKAERMDIEFTLMTGELKSLLTHLLEAMESTKTQGE